nr:HEAT repeat domain-containing protein [Nitrospirota bacterium]
MTQRHIWQNVTGLLALIGLCAGWYWQSTGVRAIPALTQALQDEQVQARVFAAQGLAETGVAAKASVPDLLEVALHDPVQYAAAEAAKALTRIDLAAARQVMAAYLPLLRDQDVQVRRKASAMLGSLGPVAKPAVPSLLGALDDTDDLVRDRAVDALATIGLPAKTVLSALTRALEDKTAFVRYTATRHFAFTLTPPPASWPLLRRLMHDPDKGVASLAQSALDRAMREPAPKASVYAQMIGMKTSTGYALQQLAMLGPGAAEALPAIMPVLQDEQALHRYLAVEVLGAIGPQATSAVPALTRLLTDEDAVVRESAAEALATIGGAGPS